MSEYFATCHVQGPISVRITANSLEEVFEQIKKNGQRWIDFFRCDAEDAFLDPDFNDDWNDFSSEDISEVMKAVGYQCVHDSGIEGYWVVWAKRMGIL